MARTEEEFNYLKKIGVKSGTKKAQAPLRKFRNIVHSQNSRKLKAINNQRVFDLNCKLLKQNQNVVEQNEFLTKECERLANLLRKSEAVVKRLREIGLKSDTQSFSQICNSENFEDCWYF